MADRRLTRHSRLINIPTNRSRLVRFPLGTLLLLGAALLALSGRVCAQLYVGDEGANTGHIAEYDQNIGGSLNGTLVSGLAGAPTGIAVAGNNLYVTNTSNFTIGEYNATTGATMNTSFITTAGSQAPHGLLVSGNTLYVSNGNVISTYNATTGNVINANFITSGLATPEGMVIVGNTLYVADAASNTIDTFDATTGLETGSSFISGLDRPISLALDGNVLFVTNAFAGTVGAYNVTTGNPIGANGASFITVPGEAWGLAVSGNNLYVSDVLSQTVGLYSAIDGSTINANFISTSGYGPQGLAVAAVPEPSSATLLTLAIPSLLGIAWRRRSRPVPSR